MTKQNILFIFTDQQHWEPNNCQDSTFNSPNIDRLVRQSTVFGRN